MKRLSRFNIGSFLGSVTVVCAMLCSGLLLAHDDHNKDILRLDQQLTQPGLTDGEQLPLLLRRADLHRQEKHWHAALADYETVATIQPANHRMLLGRAQLNLDQGHYKAAIDWSAQLLKQQGDHVQGLLVQARAQSGLKRWRTAANLFERAIKLMQNPTPDHYLEHARIVLRTNDKNARSEAIVIVDDGALRLNNPVSLHSFAVEQELLSERPAAALERINAIIARHPRLLPWQLKKVELLLSIDRLTDACLTLQNFGHEWKQLPQRRSKTRAMLSLRARASELQSVCTRD